MNRKFDYTLYLVTDRELMSTENLETAVLEAIEGGVTMVQLREKTASSREFYKQAVRIKEITGRYGVPLIVNDRIDIAMAIGADGVHIGQSDLPAAVARKIIGRDMLLGVSASSVSEALQKCVVFEDVLPAVKSAKQAGMIVYGVYDKYSAHHQSEISTLADGYLLDFRTAPLPRGEV